MAVGTIAIVSEVFPLWPYSISGIDDTDPVHPKPVWRDKVRFAVRLSTGLTFATDPTEADYSATWRDLPGTDFGEKAHAFYPWRWTVTGVRLWAFDDTAGTNASVGNVAMLGQLPTQFILSDDSHDAYLKGIEEFAGHIARIAVGPSAPLDHNALASFTLPTELDGELAQDRVHALLANMASWPAPLAHMVDAPNLKQGINLVHIVEVATNELPVDANGNPIPTTQIIAAPEFTFDNADRSPNSAPTPPPPPPTPSVFTWKYVNPGGLLDRTAYCGAATLALPNRDAVQYDPDSYFVRTPTSQLAPVLGEDPTSDLTLRIAERFDLGAMVVQLMTERVRAGQEISTNDWKKALAAAIAVGRDLAAAGLQPPTDDDGALLRRVLQDPAAYLDTDAARDIVDAVKSWQSNLDANGWEELVRSVDSGLPDNQTLADVASDPTLTETAKNKLRLDALARVATGLREEATLQRLLSAQWRKAIEQRGSDAAKRGWSLVENRLVTEILPTYNLSQSLALDNIRLFLAGVLPGRAELSRPFADVLREKVVNQLTDYADGRLSNTNAFARTPTPADGLTDPGHLLHEIATRLADQLLSGTGDPVDPTETDAAKLEQQKKQRLYGPGTPTPRPHALSFQVAPLHTEGDPSPSEDNVTTDIAGYGVLMRRSRANDDTDEQSWDSWRLLNMAQIRLEKGEALLEYHDATLNPPQNPIVTTAPFAIGYGALRHGFLTYEGQSLSARHVNPANGTDTNAAVIDFTFPVGLDDPSWQPEDWRKWVDLPELAFGAFYEIIPFIMGQGGILPRALAHDVDTAPHVLKSFQELSDSDLKGDHRRKSRYLRRVPVGPLRMAREQDAADASAAAEGVVTLAGAVPATGQLIAEGTELFRTPEGGAIDFANLPRVTLRFGGIEIGDVTGPPELLANWIWGDTDPPSTQEALTITRDGAERLIVKVGSEEVTFDEPVDNGTWIWLQIDTADPTVGNAYPIRVSYGRLAGSAVETKEIASWTPPTQSVGLQITQLAAGVSGFLQPSITLDGFAPAASPASDSAVFLLSNADIFTLPQNITLALRPPSTDVDTFKRWLRMDQFLGHKNPSGDIIDWSKVIDRSPTYLDRLRAKLAEQTRTGRASADTDAVLEDPAVTHIVAEVVPLRRGPDSGVLARETTVFALAPPPREKVDDDPDDSIIELKDFLADHAQSPSRPSFVCSVAPPDPHATSRMGTRGQTISLTIWPGEVWEVRLYAATPAEAFDADSSGADVRFHPGLGSPRLRHTFNDGGANAELVLFAPVTYRVEATRHDLPDPTIVWKSLEVAAPGDDVSAAITRPDAWEPSRWDRWDNVGTARLGYQAVVWSGRPLEPHPFLLYAGGDPFDINELPNDNATARNNTILWEASAFDNQEGRTPLAEAKTVAPTALDVPLFSTNLAAERGGGGAQHYRFRIDLDHRYRALAKDARDKRLTVRGMQGMDDAWKRLFVPARPRGPLPPPAVTFTVPLSSAPDSATSKVPGLIAYVDEPWAAVGGLAEILDVQISPAFEKKDSGDFTGKRRVEFDHQWPEFGPDPIVRKEGFSGKDAFVPVLVSDLIGQTFDTGTATPGIHGASALIPPPQIDSDPSWTMAKLRFRRVLHPRGGSRRQMASRKLDQDLVIEINGLGNLAEDTLVELSAGTAMLLSLKVDQANKLVRRQTAANSDPGEWARTSPINLTDRIYVCLRRAGQATSEDEAADRAKTQWEVTLYTDPDSALTADDVGKGGMWRPFGLGLVAVGDGEELALSVDRSDWNDWSRMPLHASDWTPAYWTQYLGAITPIGVEELSIAIASGTGGQKLEIKTAGNVTVPLKPRPKNAEETWDEGSGFYYRVLLTKTVFDASGTRGGEAAIGLYESESDDGPLIQISPNPDQPPDLTGPHEAGRLVARIMLWQEAPVALADTDKSDPWEMIFPSPSGKRREARARIVQISPPIRPPS